MLMQNLVLCLRNGGAVCSLQTRKGILEYHFHKRNVFSYFFFLCFQRTLETFQNYKSLLHTSLAAATLYLMFVDPCIVV
jgi:hypothetical protein